MALFVLVPLLKVTLGLPTVAYVAPLGVLMASAALRLGWEDGVRLPPLVATYAVLAVTLFGWLLATVLWTRSIGQHVEDAVLVTALLLLLVFLPLVLSAAVLRVLLYSTVAGGVLASIYVTYTYLQAGSLTGHRVAILDYYLVISSIIGAGAVGAALQGLVAARRRAWWGLLALVMLGGVALSLARGALVSSIGIMVMGTGIVVVRARPDGTSMGAWLRTTLWRAGLVLGVLGAVGTALYLALSVERTYVRLMRWVQGQSLFDSRSSYWTHAWDSITAQPLLGYGLGSNGLLSGTSDSLYPHNHLLQVWLDGGIVAAALLATLLVLPFAVYAWHLHRADLRALPFLGIYLFLILEYAKSANFYSGRTFIVFGLAATWAVSAACRRRRPPRPAPDAAARADAERTPVAA